MAKTRMCHHCHGLRTHAPLPARPNSRLGPARAPGVSAHLQVDEPLDVLALHVLGAWGTRGNLWPMPELHSQRPPRRAAGRTMWQLPLVEATYGRDLPRPGVDTRRQRVGPCGTEVLVIKCFQILVAPPLGERSHVSTRATCGDRACTSSPRPPSGCTEGFPFAWHPTSGRQRRS
jgi:hypothetical protein